MVKPDEVASLADLRGEERQDEAQRKASGITHEDLGRIEVMDQEPRRGPGDYFL